MYNSTTFVALVELFQPRSPTRLCTGTSINLILHKQSSWESFQQCCYCFVCRQCFHPDKCLQKKKTLLQQPSQESTKFMTGSKSGNLTLMQTKTNAALFPPSPTKTNDALHLPLEDNLWELMIPLGYLA